MVMTNFWAIRKGAMTEHDLFGEFIGGTDAVVNEVKVRPYKLGWSLRSQKRNDEIAGTPVWLRQPLDGRPSRY